MAHPDDLTHARECYTRQAWSEAHRCFLEADRMVPLAVHDLERLATAAYLLGRDLEFQGFLERAYHAHLEQAAHPAAARCAFWIGLTLLLRGEAAQASGWVARARRLIEDQDCVEHGYLLLPVAEQHLGEGDAAVALELASAAAAIGERFGDADLTACARHLQGRARIEQEDVRGGLGLLDEAMIGVSQGELSPIVTGLIYCSVIEACQRVFAFGRAREWTAALSRWCERQPDMLAFTGTCRVYRAEILQASGAWVEAMAEACRACERGARPGGPPGPAAAWYRQGEIHRLRGELDAAEAAYRHANLLGLDPQPGLALLRLAQGRTDAAIAAMRRAVGATADPLQLARLLPAYAEMALATGDARTARAASAELEEIASRFGTEVLRAHAAHVRGAVELGESQARAALGSLRRASQLWQEAGASYETARARLLLGLACKALGDPESAELQLDAAAAIFEKLGAAPDLARLASLRSRPARRAPHQLTPRELAVLRRITAGKTNKAIAAELSVSERTIDRHVSNILSKLGVSSRTAATAYAYDHKLV
jgi:DNA-binding CsgD family transcriptional regulator